MADKTAIIAIAEEEEESNSLQNSLRERTTTTAIGKVGDFFYYWTASDSQI